MAAAPTAGTRIICKLARPQRTEETTMRLRASFGWLASSLPGRSVAIVAVAASVLASPAVAWGSSPLPTSSAAYRVAAQLPDSSVSSTLTFMNGFIAASQDALARGDVTAAQTAATQFDSNWQSPIGGEVRRRSQTAYSSIEDARSEANRALNTEPIDTAQ